MELEESVAYLTEVAENIQQMDVGTDEKAIILYTCALEYLKYVPDLSIVQLGSTMWDIVYKHVVLTDVVEGATSITVLVTEFEGLLEAKVCLPLDWVTLFQMDPVYQLGGVLYTGSQMVDFYNHRLIGNKEQCDLRSQAYEAELILQISRMVPEYSLQPYQEDVLAMFPQGLQTKLAKTLLYDSAPVQVIEA